MDLNNVGVLRPFKGQPDSVALYTCSCIYSSLDLMEFMEFERSSCHEYSVIIAAILQFLLIFFYRTQ